MNIIPHVPIMIDQMCEHLLTKKDDSEYSNKEKNHEVIDVEYEELE